MLEPSLSMVICSCESITEIDPEERTKSHKTVERLEEADANGLTGSVLHSPSDRQVMSRGLDYILFALC